MSYKYALRCLSIDDSFRFVQFFLEIRILNGIVFHKIHLPTKLVLQCELEGEIVFPINQQR